ncbi:response regulator transcription factor [Butyrivibrio sp. VCD2006]|uniref:response regulator transcription factor n=1 Tax=Butyrivibrio sp. VCD2006 TaxID=1280664 RepID=UPI00040780CD|nr:response regulator transcription factor [Butyrivibrio sp. VCD2006]
MHKIMLIDDDKDVLNINSSYLTEEGYEVIIYCTADDAIKALKKEHPDCIVLDIMMPGTDGLSAVSIIKDMTDTPIILLSGRDSEDDRVEGLLSGADDYITKPYSLKELSARIKLQISKKKITKTANIISYPPLQIKLLTHKVYYNNDTEIQLSNREYELLLMLVSSPDKIITFEEIGKKIWGIYQEGDRRSIMVQASRLRKKLCEFNGLQNCIETSYGKGYKFIIPH